MCRDRCLNGEDHYSAGGQMDYLHRYGNDLARIQLAINVDDVGCKDGGSAYSFYGCPPDLQVEAEVIFQDTPGIVAGEPWFNGDHMIFVQKQIPALAFTAENVAELMRTVTHTAQDTPSLIDHRKLVELVQVLNHLIRSL